LLAMYEKRLAKRELKDYNRSAVDAKTEVGVPSKKEKLRNRTRKDKKRDGDENKKILRVLPDTQAAGKEKSHPRNKKRVKLSSETKRPKKPRPNLQWGKGPKRKVWPNYGSGPGLELVSEVA